MTDYEFQWAGAHTFSSIYDRSCFTYGPYAFGKPKQVDYVAFVRHGKAEAYVSNSMMEEWKRSGTRLLEPAFAEEYFRRCRDAGNRMNAFYAEFKAADLNTAQDEELYRFMERLTRHIQELGALFVATQPAGTHALEAAIREKTDEAFAAGADAAFCQLVQPVDDDIISREQDDFRALLAKAALTEADLKAHAEKHAWLFYQTYDSASPLRFLKERLEKERKTPLHGTIESKVKLKHEQDRLFSQLDATTAERCHLLQHLALERLELKAHWAGADFRFLPLFQHIARRLGVPLLDLAYAYGLEDLENALLHGKPLTPDVVRQRRFAYAVRNQNGRRTLYGPQDAEALKKQLSIQPPEPLEPLHGMVAHPGHVQGPAYVVTVGSLEELERDEKAFPEGGVMIVAMTQPNQLAIVRKACAIVTDEGGTVSHAAIIAREFGKPCIVGTKSATRTYKTGDWIEVNANAGVVRKKEPNA
ncbi:hypothetical protein HYV43_02405 [Candidatus Micrarchaeota archaeon]|nr:hypothetical protein [Candidatus Micrarchaeota archaeon]